MKKKPVLSFFIVSLLIIVIASLLVACGVATTTTPTTKPAPAKTGGQVAIMPHTLEGRGDCLACHETGIGGAKAIPADHAGRANATCTACHKPAN